MAVVNLPDSPANGTTETVGGITYTYDSSKGYWTAASSGGGGGGGGGASVSTSDAAPGSPSDGDLWYDTDEGGMFVYYQDTDSSQWVEVIGSAGSDGAAGAAGADGSATVVADTTALLAISSPSAGDQVYVTANNTLYFYNGSGWYKIALINTNPTISGVSSSYALAIDGTATTVTITATDPEGLPITYSIASDTSGNIATVAQGTGASTNVFTVTPSTNSAHAGSFSLTFRASDGVNFATAPATFTLQFSVPNQKYTSALITSVGANNAVNNSFDDKSTSNHTITVAGNATQTTFSPYRHGGYSTYFDGSGDNLTTASAILSTSGAFTVQCWVYLDDTSNATLWAQGTSGNSQRASVTIEAGNWYAQIGSAVINTTAAVANVWKFIEFQYDGSQIELFVDGTSVGTASTTTNAQNTGLFIGKLWAGGYDLQGYITDLRVINGTPSGSSTAPTTRLTAVTNTSLLACHLPYIADGSTNSHAITVNGNTKTLPFAPYDAQEYSASSHGGSAHFDGTGDYLSVADDASFTIGSGDFTAECWVYPTASPSQPLIFGQWSNPYSWAIQLSNDGNRNARMIFHDGAFQDTTTATSVALNAWTHLALVKNGSAATLYVNGVVAGTDTVGTLTDSSSALTLGAQAGGGQPSQGIITDARLVVGTAVYTSAFTPPTAPLTAITNTSLLLQGTDAGIIDKSQTAESVQLFADTKSSTAQYKFLSSSIYFDGTGDYLKTSSSGNFLAEGPWTQEMWLHLTNTSANQQIGPAFGGGVGGWNSSNGHQWILYTYNGACGAQYYGTNNSHNTISLPSVSTLFTANTWQHWAISWDGTTLRFFMDGTSVHTTTSFSPNTMTATHTELGRMPDNSYYSQAYYSDVRITKGLARYTANFTPPTAALQG